MNNESNTTINTQECLFFGKHVCVWVWEWKYSVISITVSLISAAHWKTLSDNSTLWMLPWKSYDRNTFSFDKIDWSAALSNIGELLESIKVTHLNVNKVFGDLEQFYSFQIVPVCL